MAGIAKGARPAPDARSRPARHRHCGWQRTVGRDPVGRDAVRLGIASGRNAGGRGDRARPRRLLKRIKWRSYRDGKPYEHSSSRPDHCAGGPAQAARDRLEPPVRRWWRIDVLRARPGRSEPTRGNMSIASSRARSPPTCRCRRRPSTNWSSISRPPKRSASTCRRRCSPAPTR